VRKAALTGAGIGIAIPVIRSINAPNAQATVSTCTRVCARCNAQTCCDVGGKRVACNGSSACCTYYSNAHPAGGTCFNNSGCLYPNKCVGGVCTPPV
jgi:hypothetical protein